METKDLMLGDWVYREGHDDIPIQVIGINESCVTLKLDNGFCGEAIDSIAPIPLTLEILKLNGKKDDGAFWLYRNNIAGCFYVIHNEMFHIHGFKHCFDGKADYVHELQHALRLCGLNELADNLKIE